jgi:hypothetical protein
MKLLVLLGIGLGQILEGSISLNSTDLVGNVTESVKVIQPEAKRPRAKKKRERVDIVPETVTESVPTETAVAVQLPEQPIVTRIPVATQNQRNQIEFGTQKSIPVQVDQSSKTDSSPGSTFKIPTTAESTVEKDTPSNPTIPIIAVMASTLVAAAIFVGYKKFNTKTPLPTQSKITPSSINVFTQLDIQIDKTPLDLNEAYFQ